MTSDEAKRELRWLVARLLDWAEEAAMDDDATYAVEKLRNKIEWYFAVMKFDDLGDVETAPNGLEDE